TLLANRRRLFLFLLVDRFGLATLGVAAAAEESAKAVPAHDHWFAAFWAHARVRRNDVAHDIRALLLTSFELLLERAVEIGEHITPLELAFLDLVELAFHTAREADIEDRREQSHQNFGDRLTERRRLEALLLELRSEEHT